MVTKNDGNTVGIIILVTAVVVILQVVTLQLDSVFEHNYYFTPGPHIRPGVPAEGLFSVRTSELGLGVKTSPFLHSTMTSL
jgi:hypothetical protein